jgi:predicted phosphodiesterase
MPSRRAILRAVRRAGVVLGVIAVALAGVLLGMRLAGAQTYSTDLGTVRLEVEPALPGQVDAYIPIADWGIRANAFSAPLKLSGEVRSVNRQAVLRAAGGDNKALERARTQLDDAARSVLLREALFAALGAVLATAVALLALRAFRKLRRRTLVATGGAVAGTAVAIIVVTVWLALTTFDPETFDHPHFYAHGAELLQLLDAAAHSDERANRYRDKVKGTLVRLSDLLASSGVGGERATIDAGRRALLASDLHANTLVLDAVEQLAAPRRPVFFVGDFGHNGSEGEVRVVAPRLRRLGSSVIAVSGNHDSTALMERLASVGVTVLTDNGRLRPDGSTDGKQVIDVEGLRVAGFSDPLEWHGTRPDDPRRIFGFSELANGDQRRVQAEDDLVKWYDGLPEHPNVVLVHQNGLAQHLAATIAERPGHEPVTILTGHDHKQHVDRHGDIVVIDAGSVGAGGVLGIGDEDVGVADLHFEAAAPAVAAVDLVQVDPFSGSAQAQRVIVDGNDCATGETSCQLSP